MRNSAIERFVRNIEDILNGVEIDLYDSLIDSSFEYITSALISDQREQGIWYDGTGDLVVSKRKSRQLEFRGNMNVALEQEKFWIEPFYAKVTDKRNTNQGVVILVHIGDYKAEGDLFEIFKT